MPRRLLPGWFIALLVLLLAGFIAAVTIGAATAKATTGYDNGSVYGGGYMGDHDAYALWSMTDELGAQETVATIGAKGRSICAELASGLSEGAIVNDALTNYGVPTRLSRLIVHGAEYHFCPEYY
jgi:hypothetical protein